MSCCSSFQAHPNVCASRWSTCQPCYGRSPIGTVSLQGRLIRTSRRPPEVPACFLLNPEVHRVGARRGSDGLHSTVCKPGQHTRFGRGGDASLETSHVAWSVEQGHAVCRRTSGSVVGRTGSMLCGYSNICASILFPVKLSTNTIMRSGGMPKGRQFNDCSVATAVCYANLVTQVVQSPATTRRIPSGS